MRPEEMDYATEIDHDGRTYQVRVPGLRTPRCQNPNCRTILLTPEANRAITAAFRRAAGLLEPEEIRRQREKLGLTQAALAERLEVGTATVSRWETGGQVQQRSLDKLLRLYFDLPEVRRALALPTQGQFRCLRPTPELRHRAGQFRLTAANGLTGSEKAVEACDETAEASTGKPAAE